MLNKAIIFSAALALMPMSAIADDNAMTTGGDGYRWGMNVSVKEPLQRDGFLSGFSVSVKAKVEKDLHAVGAFVDIDAPVGADAYAAAMTVRVSNIIGEDLTAAAANIRLDDGAKVLGNSRLTGADVIVDGSIDGALVAAASHLEVNGLVKGDAHLTARELEFGQDARISGTLFYSAPEQLQIPESVVPAARVKIDKLPAGTIGDTIDEAARQYGTHFSLDWPARLLGFASAVAFLVLAGAAFLWWMPVAITEMTERAIASPIKAIITGMCCFAAILGLVPICGMTIIGIPLIPLLILLAVVGWLIGYLLGVCAVAARVASGFGWGGADIWPTSSCARAWLDRLCDS